MLSIIIPTFNNQKELDILLPSIISLSFNKEIIISDRYSKDINTQYKTTQGNCLREQIENWVSIAQWKYIMVIKPTTRIIDWQFLNDLDKLENCFFISPKTNDNKLSDNLIIFNKDRSLLPIDKRIRWPLLFEYLNQISYGKIHYSWTVIKTQWPTLKYIREIWYNMRQYINKEKRDYTNDIKQRDIIKNENKWN